MNLRILTLSTGVLILVACSDHSTKSSGGTIQEVHTAQYRLSENGCDTEVHAFSGATDDEVRTLLCEELQNDSLNHGCAPNLRREYFDRNCPGQVWIVIRQTPVDTPAPAPAAPADSINSQLEQKVREHLRRVFVSEFSLDAAVPEKNREQIQNLGIDLWSCGISDMGINCLNYSPSLVNSTVTLNGDDLKVYSEFRSENLATDLAYIIGLKMLNGTVQIQNVTVVRVLIERAGDTVTEFYADPNHIMPLIHLTVKDPVDFAVRLSAPRNLRSLFHTVTERWSNGARLKPADIKASLEKNKRMIKESTDEFYQEALLDHLTSLVSDRDPLYLELASSFMASTSKTLSLKSAAEVLSIEPTRQDARALVLEGLVFESSSVRQASVKALAKARPSLEEQNLIVAAVGDQDYGVRQQALAGALTFSLSDGHLIAVEALSRSEKSSVRVSAVTLLDKINSEKATHRLVSMIGDEDYGVREAAFAKSSKVRSQPKYLEDLIPLLKSEVASIRLNAAIMVGGYETNDAISTLIANIADQDYGVRETVFQSLKKKTLSEEQLVQLLGKARVNSSGVRLNIVQLMGLNASDVASLALIGSLDDADYGVRTAAKDLTLRRTIKDSFVSALRTKLQSSVSGVRLNVVLILKENKGTDSTTALLERLDDEEYSVRQAIESIIAARALSDDRVILLGTKLAAANSSARAFAARCLGRIKTSASLKLLTDRLAIESDYGVKQAITSSIQSIGVL